MLIAWAQETELEDSVAFFRTRQALLVLNFSVGNSSHFYFSSSEHPVARLNPSTTELGAAKSIQPSESAIGCWITSSRFKRFHGLESNQAEMSLLPGDSLLHADVGP